MLNKVVVVGVVGGSGSGKTSLIRAFRQHLPQGTVALVSQDDYYLPKEQQMLDANGQVNYDLPTAIDLEALAVDLRTIAQGLPIRRREYTFNNTSREAGWVETQPAPIVLVEGLFVLHHPDVREQFHERIFVQASETIQLQRRIKRDAEERGYDEGTVRYQWDNHVMPAFNAYLEPHVSTCHPISNESDLDSALHHFRARLSGHPGLAHLFA